jgi:hypothetical protein
MTWPLSFPSKESMFSRTGYMSYSPRKLQAHPKLAGCHPVIDTQGHTEATFVLTTVGEDLASASSDTFQISHNSVFRTSYLALSDFQEVGGYSLTMWLEFTNTCHRR